MVVPETEDLDSSADVVFDTAAPVTEEAVGDQPGADDPAAWLFGLDVVHTVAIELDDSAWDDFAADPYGYVEGHVEVDGERVEDVGVRLRGKIGSARSISQKPKFKIDFNAWLSDQRFYGLETLSLNNSVVDCSYLKESVGYAAFAAAGVPAPRTGYAWVTVNGADYGLYTIIETPDDRFLESRWADGSGNLYDGKYVWYGGYSYTLLDFAIGVDALFSLEEGTDVGNADITAISEVLAATRGTADFYEATGAVLDWDAVHRMLIVEQWVGHLDGYAQNTNNYRVYFDPADGRAELVPWDLDYAFLAESTWGMSWASPRGTLAAACYADATCRAAHAAVAADVIADIDAAGLGAFLEQAAALTEADALRDPRRECAVTTVPSERAALTSWVAGQSANVRAFWGI